MNELIYRDHYINQGNYFVLWPKMWACRQWNIYVSNHMVYTDTLPPHGSMCSATTGMK
jgi:hypothetical protein